MKKPIKIDGSRETRAPQLPADAHAGLVIQPARAVRDGWRAQVRAMHEAGDDQLVDDASATGVAFDVEEWDW